jgi:hypothetical protein
MRAFHMWMVGYHHFKKLPINVFFIKMIFSMMLYKTNCGVLKFKSHVLKAKLNLNSFTLI